MKAVSNTLIVAATINITVDAFQVPLGSKITGRPKGQRTLSSARTTNTSSLPHPRRSLPFLSQIRSSLNENDDMEVDDENDDYDSDANGRYDSIVDQLSLEEQKELILQQLSMMDDDEDDPDLGTRGKVHDENVRSNSFNIEDAGYYKYYDDVSTSQRNDQSYFYDDNYYGYDDTSEDLPPRERRRRRRQREAASSFSEAASDLAETAIRIGGKATNVAKKTTEKAWQSLVENTFEDEWDKDEYQPQNQRGRRASSRPSRSTTRPRSRYERDRRGISSPRPREKRARQNDYTTHRYQGEEEKYDQRDGDRIRRDPRKANPGERIEKPTDSFESTDASRRVPSRSQRAKISNEGDTDNTREEEMENDENGSSNDGDDLSWKSVLEKTSNVASKKAKAIPRKIVDKAERTAKKAKEMSYKAVANFLEEDEEEEGSVKVDPVVMDAVIEEKTEDRVVEAEAIPMGEWPSNAWSKSQQPSNSSNRSENMRDATFEAPSSRPRPRKRQQASSSGPRRRRRPRPRRPQREDSDKDVRVTSRRSVHKPDDQQQEQKYYYGLFQLPPAEGTFEQPTMDQQPSTREESTERTSRRKVYSPYKSNNRRRRTDDYEYYEDMDDVYTDGVDRMGNFVAEALDTFLWGREDGEDRPNINRRSRRNAEASDRQSTNNKSTPKRHKRSGHWKDRMEEQFDEFLGIHEGGKYYDRWANQESEIDDLQESNRRKNGTGRDPVSFARGEVKRGKRRGHSRPIWEEESSLLSILFGTDNDTVRRNARMYRSSSDLPFLGNGGSLLRLVQSLLQSGALVAGRVSQWASVRGSLPQPVIVVGLLSALLSARPGRRWQTVLFATLTLRMMGELLHNYMYDDLDFEDDLSVVSHKDNRNSELEDDDFDVGKYDGADYM